MIRVFNFVVFWDSLKSAAAPATFEVWHRVSATVTSQMRYLPYFQAVNVRPSGLFPSDLMRLEGSFTAGIFAWRGVDKCPLCSFGHRKKGVKNVQICPPKGGRG